MASKVAIAESIQTYSRFALLEEDSEEERIEKEEEEKKSNAAKNAKKRARRKKKAAATTNELRNLAFSKPISAKAIQNVHHERHAQPDAVTTNGHTVVPMAVSPPSAILNNMNQPTENVDEADWETWKNKDEEFVIAQFQRDLENALRMSKEFSMATDADVKKAIKKKPNAKTMPLNEFVSTTPDLPKQDTSFLEQPQVPTEMFYVPNGYSPEELDPYHFDTVPTDDIITPTPPAENAPTPQKKKKKKKKTPTTEDSNTLSELLQELHTEEKEAPPLLPDTVACTIDAASVASFENALEEKDKEIVRLNELNEKLKDELGQVKKRNKQLCFILAQGEMKDKSEILLQVDELTNIKNELSEELSEMHTLLEQERSKVSSLKSEMLKQQNQRAHSKSTCEDK